MKEDLCLQLDDRSSLLHHRTPLGVNFTPVRHDMESGVIGQCAMISVDKGDSVWVGWKLQERYLDR